MSQQINIQQIPLKTIVSIAIVAFLLILFQSAYVIVEAGHVGVVKRLGAVQLNPLNEGFHLKLPDY